MKSKLLSVRLPADFYTKLRIAAASADKNLSHFVIGILQSEIDKQPKQLITVDMKLEQARMFADMLPVNSEGRLQFEKEVKYLEYCKEQGMIEYKPNPDWSFENEQPRTTDGQPATTD